MIIIHLDLPGEQEVDKLDYVEDATNQRDLI